MSEYYPTAESTEEARRMREDRIKNDPLAVTIQSLTDAMKADFGRSYSNQFSDPEELRLYKRRLYQKLRGLHIEDIKIGYEKYVDTGHKYCPTVPELLDVVKQAEKVRKQSERAWAETERKAQALPSPTIQCNPLEMLAEAQAKAEQGKGSGVSKEQLLANHKAVLEIFGTRIRKPRFGPQHKCAVSFCNKFGTLSSGTTGHGNFYCVEHYRMEA